jgi:hypothetical protein
MLRMNHSKIIDPTSISTTRILWCATRKYMILVTENQLKSQIDGSVDDDKSYSEL